MSCRSTPKFSGFSSWRLMVAVGCLVLAAAGVFPAQVAAQEGDPGAGRGEGQEIIYLNRLTVAPVLIQLPEGYDAEQTYPLIVALHGHGGRGDEFFTPSPRFAAAGVIYAVLQAPYALQMVGRIGYSWNLRGVDNDAGDQGENELSIDYVLSAVDALVGRFAPASVYLMGFSQGGTFTYRTAIRHHDKFDGFLIFGSWYRSEWFEDSEVEAANGLRVFIGHGLQDGVVERSTVARDTLEGFGYDVTLYHYEGGHMIAVSALDEMFKWIDADQ